MKVLLVGMPKSGTTLLYYRLKNSLPPDTESLYEPRTPEEATPTQKNALAKIVASDRFKPLTSKIIKQFDTRIWLARDPRDIFISLFLWQLQFTRLANSPTALEEVLDLLRAKEANPDKVPFREIVTARDTHDNETFEEFARRRFDHGLQLRSQLKKYHTVHYEDLIEEDTSELENKIGFPVQPAPPTKNWETLHQRTARTKAAKNWQHWLTPSDTEWLYDFLQPYREKFEYQDTSWELAEQQHINPLHSSIYAISIINTGIRRQQAELLQPL